MRRLPPVLAGLAVLVALGVVAQHLIHFQTGPMPLVGVFEVHLMTVAAVAALLALPGAVARGTARTRLALVAVLVLATVRLGGELWSPGPPPEVAASGEHAGDELTVLSWNLENGARAAGATVAGIAALDADLVALQELTRDAAAAIEADAGLVARYPYRILEPRDGVEGMGILARLPLVVGEYERDPMVLHADLLLRDGRRLEILDVHPYPPSVRSVAGFPLALDTRRRDEHLRLIAGRVAALAEPAAALVVGDFNTAATEPAFAAVAAGLTDAHGAVGSGPGFTWRPSSLEGVGLGVLRIDHVLAGGWLTPLAVDEDCALVGDHCRLLVTLRVEPDGG